MKKKYNPNIEPLKKALSKCKVPISPIFFEDLALDIRYEREDWDTILKVAHKLSRSSSKKKLSDLSSELSMELYRFRDKATYLANSLNHIVFLLQNSPPFITPSASTNETAKIIASIALKAKNVFLSLSGINVIMLEDDCFVMRDYRLNIIKSFPLFKIGKVTHIFEKFSHDEVVIICEGQNPYLVRVSLNYGAYTTIYSPFIKNITPFYWWPYDEILLSNDKGEIISIHLKTQETRNIPQAEAPHFYQLVHQAKSLHAGWTNPVEYTVTFLEKDKKSAAALQVVCNQKAEAELDNSEYDLEDIYQVQYCDPRWLFIGRRNIYFQGENYWGYVQAPDNWTFYQVLLFAEYAADFFVLSRSEQKRDEWCLTACKIIF